MISCLGFPPVPPDGCVSVCEINGKVCHKPSENANPTEFTNSVSEHPMVSLTHDILHSSAREDARQIFLPVEEKLFKRVVSTWMEQGTLEALQLVADPEEDTNPLVRLSAQSVLKAVHGLSLIHNAFSPHLRASGEQLLAAVSQTRCWNRSPVRCLAWHPHSTKLAVAAWDDSVRVFSASTPGLIPTLRSKGQRSVSCLAWRPHSASELAVGCQAGVLVWQVDPKSVVTRPSAGCATVLKRAGHTPVTSIQWNSTGSLLISASAADTTMYIWDVDLQDSVPICRMGGGGVCLVLWAPDLHKLFSATSGVVFRVWNTNNWIPERWRVQSGRVRTACWSPCSTVLLFTTSEEALVYALHFKSNLAQIDSVFNRDSPDTEQTARVVINLAPQELENGERIGGPVISMAWDKMGRHLALIFENSSLVAVYRTDIKPHLLITPCCLIKGTQGELPNIIDFQKNFEAGACLTVAWSSGRVQYFPLVYQDLQSPSHFARYDQANYSTNNLSVFETSGHRNESLLHSFYDSFLSY